MKIVVVSTPVFQCPPPGYSGLEFLAWQQARGLAKKGHEVALIAPEGSHCEGATIIPIGPPGNWDERRAYSTYWQELPKYDCVIDHSWSKWAYILKAEGRLKAPILAVCHAPVQTMYQSLPPVDKPCFVCISQDQANHFQALFSRDARVAYNGVDMTYYSPLGIKRSNRFLFLARFSTIKGPEIAQDVCIECNEGLDLIGDTSITGEPEYFERCKKKADGKQIKIIGGVPRGETVWWYNQARALLHPNKLFREPFGLAPVESQLCGCPVLCWDYGAMRETVKHGETGFLVKSQDDMVQIIKSRALDGLDRNKCREWASQFSVERMIDRYVALCEEAVTTGGW